MWESCRTCQIGGCRVQLDTKNDSNLSVQQEADSRLWSYVYPSKYSEALKAQEEDRWKEERERRGREERQRPNDGVQKEAGKEGADGRAQPLPEEHQDRGREMRFPHMQFPSALPQHQAYMPYLQGPYAYSQGYEPSHPGFRGMPSVVMQNYPGEKTLVDLCQPGSVWWGSSEQSHVLVAVLKHVCLVGMS